jgi:hypothetical protein
MSDPRHAPSMNERSLVMTRNGTNDKRKRASPELADAIESIAAAAGSRPATLMALRAALQRGGVSWSREGELLFPQDRTALVIELDELIDAHGPEAALVEVLAGAGA